MTSILPYVKLGMLLTLDGSIFMGYTLNKEVIVLHRKMFELVLTVNIMKENGSFIAYSPALDLSTSGNSFEKAKERFEEIAPLFIEELEKEGTLEEVLSSLGWRKVYKPHKRWIPPRHVGQIQEKIKLPCPA